jgi:enamine deaminase RidA (YjgF/YER057c/UK114 family)
MQAQENKHQLKRFHVGERLSEMAVHNGTVYLAGQVTSDDSLDMTGQTKNVLAQIDALLEQAGSDKSRILMCQIFISDFNNFTAMNQVWDSWVTQGSTPLRATVQAALANPAWLIEIVITAAIS